MTVGYIGGKRVTHRFARKHLQALITTYLTFLFRSYSCGTSISNKLSTLCFLKFAFLTFLHFLTLFLLLECSSLATSFELLLAILQASDHMTYAWHETSLILSRRSFGVLSGFTPVSGNGTLKSSFPQIKIGANNT